MKPGRSIKAGHLALSIAVMVAVCLPLGYFALGYQKLAIILETEAEANSLFASQVIHANPDFWPFEQARLQEFLTHHSAATARESRSIVNLKGSIVAWNQTEADYPAIIRSHYLYESGKVVGALEIARSLRPLLWETILVGVLGCLLMAAIYFSLKNYVIDAREKAEKALRESEERYRVLVNNIPAVVYTGYSNWEIDFFGDKIEEFLGYSKEEFKSRRLTWRDVIVEEDFENIKQIFIEALKTNKSYVREYRVRTKQGRIVWIQERSSIICDQDNKIDYISGVLFDITPRRQAEEALKEQFKFMETLIDNIPGPIFYKNIDGVFLGCNQVFSDFLGIPKAEIIGKTVYDFSSREQADKYSEMDAALFRQPGVQVYDFSVLHADGTIHDVSFYKATYCAADGTLAGLVGVMLDITERKQAEEALSRNHQELQEAAQRLEQSRNTLQLIIESIPARVFWKDRNSCYLGCNTLFAEDAGFSQPQELLGKDDFAMGWCEQAEIYRDDDRQVMESRRPKLNFVEQQTTPTGDKIWLNTSKVPLQGLDGEVFGVLGVYEDVTERKQMEEALREVQNQQRAILDNIPDIAWLKDRESRYIAANEPFARSCGFSREELVGRTDFDFRPLDLAIRYRQDDAEVMRTGQQKLVEEPFVDIEGKTVWIETIKTPVYNDQGEVIGTTGIARDITARKQAADELRLAHAEIEQLFASITSIMIGLTPTGEVRHWNEEAEKVLGVTGRAALRQKLHKLPLNWDWSKISEAIGACRKQCQAVRVDNVRFRRQGEKDGFLGISISPIKEESGEVSGLILLGRDITERLILEMQLAQAQKLESIGHLAAGIAHEINTPIQYVGDNTRFLRDTFQELFTLLEKYREVLDAAKTGAAPGDLLEQVESAIKIVDLDYLTAEIPAAINQSLEGVERVAGIVRAMKDFSHPGSVEKQTVDINKALESTITVARNEWKYVAEMVTDLDPSLPLVPCRPDEINQVFLNIIINAAHAIGEAVGPEPAAKGKISVKTSRNGEGVDISISDTGGGIPEEISSRIFDPFFTTKEVGKGTGQGLAISHAVIVEKHGGAINFESVLGQGTTFTIHLPVETGTQ